MPPAAPMRPLYFGPPGRRLFGVYQPSAAHSAGRNGALLCHPMGDEFIRVHPYFVQLGFALADKGFDVLRFDSFGCGDSEGESGVGTLEQWLQDVDLALAELRRLSGREQVALVGVRLGASLALLASQAVAGHLPVVLWQPIVDGAAYLEELDAMQADWLAGSFAAQREDTDSGDTEVLGFPISATLRTELRRLNLMELSAPPPHRALLVSSTRDPRTEALATHLRSQGAEIEHRSIPDSRAWLKEKGNHGLGSLRVLRAVGLWLEQELA